MTLVLYKGPEATVDLSDTSTKFYETKSRLHRDYSSFLEEDLAELTNYMDDILLGKVKDQRDLSAFINGEFPDIIKIMMNKCYRFSADIRNQAKIQPFIFRSIIFILELISPKFPSLYDTLVLILNSTVNYYSYNTFYGAKDYAEEMYKKFPYLFEVCQAARQCCDDYITYLKPPNGKTEEEAVLQGHSKDENCLISKTVALIREPKKNFIRTSCLYSKVSIVYLVNLNFFVQIGGIEKVTQYAKNSYNLNSTLATIELFNSLRNFLDPDYFDVDMLPYLNETIKTLPTTLNEEDIKNSKKDDIAKLIKLVQSNIKSHSNEASDVTEILYHFELNILLICLKSSSLDKRLFSITSLIEKIAEAERNQEDYVKLKSMNAKCNIWFTSENYINWLNKNEITNILLGDSSHVELLRRSSALFRYLFRNDSLSMDKIDAFCKLALEKHDTHRKHILKILCDLAELMNYTNLNHLFDMISELSPQEIDQDILALIKTIGNNISVISKTKNENDSGAKSAANLGQGTNHKPSRFRPGANDINEQRKKPRREPGEEEWARGDVFGAARAKWLAENQMSPEDETVYQLINEKSDIVKSSNERMEEEHIENDDDRGKQIKDNKDTTTEIETETQGDVNNLGRRVLDFLWEITSSKGISPGTIGTATVIIKEMLGGKLAKERIHFIEKTIQALSKNMLVNEVIDILQNILKGQFPVLKKDGTPLNTKKDLIVYLDTEFSLTHVLFNSLIQLKSDTLAKLENEPHIKSHEPTNDSNTMNEEETKESETLTTNSTEHSDLQSEEHLVIKKEQAPGAGYQSEYINAYIRDFESRLRFIRFLKQNSFEQLEFKHANLLWNLLAENALNEREREIFFTFFTSVIYAANSEFNILHEDVINYLFSDILLNIQFSSYSPGIYSCFEAFFMYLNRRYELIKFEVGPNFKVHSLDLIGLESLWELYLNSIDPKVATRAQEFLLKLGNSLADKNQRVYFIEFSMKHIEKAYSAIKDKPQNSLQSKPDEHIQRISHCLNFIIRILEEFGELHLSKGAHSSADSITVTISNSFSNALAPKKFQLILFRTQTLADAKEIIASKLNPPVSPNELMIMSKGAVLNSEKLTLDELKVQNDQTLLCCKQQTAEDIEMQPMIGPQLPGVPSPHVPASDPADIYEMIEKIQNIIPDCEPDLIKFVLRKKNYDVDETAMTLLEPSIQDYFRGQMQEEEKKQPAGPVRKEKPKEGEVRVSQLIANNPDNFELLFKILNLKINELESRVWSLLTNLPMNTAIYNNLKHIFPDASQIAQADDMDFIMPIDWSAHLDSKNPHKLLYSLQIIYNLVSCTILDEKDQDITEKAEWRVKFLEQGGLGYLLDLFHQFDPSLLTASQPAALQRTHNTEAKVISIILSIIKLYVHGALIATADPKHQNLILEALKLTSFIIRHYAKQNEQDNKQEEGEGSAKKGSEMDIEGGQQGSGGAVAPPSAGSQQIQVDEFYEFVKSMKEGNGLANIILELIEFPKFITKVMCIIEASLEDVSKDRDLTGVVEGSIQFILPCFIKDFKLLQVLYDQKNIHNILKTVFITGTEQTVRTTFAHLINFLSTNSVFIYDTNGSNVDWPEKFFIKALLPFIFNLKIDDHIPEDYFQTLSNLIRLVGLQVISEITDVKKLFLYTLKFIRDRPILEERSSEFGDRVLGGFLQFAQSLVQVDPELHSFFSSKDSGDLLRSYGLSNLDIIKELYDYLFYLPGENEQIDPNSNLPKCKYKTTRLHAFQLLYLVSIGDLENLQKLLDLLEKNHRCLPPMTFEATSTSVSELGLKNISTFAGLKNLGCTCYMNSLIQQFYMIIPLRNALMNSDFVLQLGPEQLCPYSKLTKEDSDKHRDVISQKLQDNVLYQLQLLLAQLKETIGQYVVPEAFFNSIKTINGEKIVCTVQQDVNEFFNTLCDKLEGCMKGTPNETVLNDLIGGNLSHEIISLEKDYPYYAEREEAYLTIPLDIKNKRDLNQALDMYIKEDILEGDNMYYCEKYERKIRVMKRCCVKTLPNTLIITLKRFDFDFSTMQKVKINDYFEFPMSINFKPWTKVGLQGQIPPEANYEPPNYEDSYYEYDLVGVLVHSGTAEGGHYYSFIKDRHDPSKGWFEFNDSRVKPFDLKNLKSECFGSDSGSGAGSSSVYDYDYKNSANAYILFYERPVIQKNETLVKFANTDVPTALADNILRDNLEVLRGRYFYDIDYFKFVQDIVKLHVFPEVSSVPIKLCEPDDVWKMRQDTRRALRMLEAKGKEEMEEEEPVNIDEEMVLKGFENEFKILRLIIVLAVEIYSKNREGEQFAGWMKIMGDILQKFAPGQIWFIKYITANPDILKLMYLEGVSTVVKDSFRELLGKVVPMVYEIESGFFTEKIEWRTVHDNEVNVKMISRASLARFLTTFSHEFIMDKDRDLSKPLDYFKLVASMIKMDRVVAHFMIQEGLLEEYFELLFHIQKLYNTTFPFSKDAKEKEKYHYGNLVPILNICEFLIRSCITNGAYETKTLPPTYLFDSVTWDTCPRVPQKCFDLISDIENFRKMFLSLIEKGDYVINMLAHMCWEEYDFSKKVLFQTISHCCSIIMNYRGTDEDMRFLYHVLKLKDSHQAERVSWIFSDQPLKYSTTAKAENLIQTFRKAKDNFDKAQTALGLRWFAMMADEIPMVKDKILKNLGDFDWIQPFLKTHMNSRNSIYIISESELSAKLPQWLKQSYDIFVKIFPLEGIPEEIPEAKNEMDLENGQSVRHDPEVAAASLNEEIRPEEDPHGKAEEKTTQN